MIRRLRWHSSMDGELGSGRALSVVLKPGRHIITLSALAPDGGQARAVVHSFLRTRRPCDLLTCISCAVQVNLPEVQSA